MNEDVSFEEIQKRMNELLKRKESILHQQHSVVAELAARKRTLQKTLDECRESGFDPDKLPDETRKMKEILLTKMEVFSADLDSCESILKPMIKEIEKG